MEKSPMTANRTSNKNLRIARKCGCLGWWASLWFERGCVCREASSNFLRLYTWKQMAYNHIFFQSVSLAPFHSSHHKFFYKQPLSTIWRRQQSAVNKMFVSWSGELIFHCLKSVDTKCSMTIETITNPNSISISIIMVIPKVKQWISCQNNLTIILKIQFCQEPVKIFWFYWRAFRQLPFRMLWFGGEKMRSSSLQLWCTFSGMTVEGK